MILRAMSTKRSRVLMYCLVVVALLCGLTNQFLPEVFAMGWHIRHGRTARLKSFDGRRYAVDVPRSWWPQIDGGNWSIDLLKRPGRLRASLGESDWGDISFSLVPEYPTAEEVRKTAPILAARGLTQNEVSLVRVAGQDLYCFEENWSDAKVARLTRNRPIVSVNCVPLQDKRQFSAQYSGTPAFLPDFYSVLGSVKRID